MKSLIFGFALSLLGIGAYADDLVQAAAAAPLSTITYERGSAIESGFCDGAVAYSCIDQIKYRAQNRAAEDARWRCEIRQGQTDRMYPSCDHFCNPNYLPPESRGTYVTCNSNCSVRCEIP